MPIEDYQPLPLPKEKVGRVLSDEERERLLRVAGSNPNWEAAYLFAMISVNTGAGPKEVASLRLKDVDWQREEIHIPPHGAKNVTRIRPIPLNCRSHEGNQAGGCESEETWLALNRSTISFRFAIFIFHASIPPGTRQHSRQPGKNSRRRRSSGICKCTIFVAR
jgi:integrase